MCDRLLVFRLSSLVLAGAMSFAAAGCSAGAGTAPAAVTTALNVTPASVPLAAAGAASASTVTVSEPGYAGPFAESDSCSGIATVASSNALGPTATFTVTAQAAGSCNAAFSDTLGQQVRITVAVATGTLGINALAR